MASTSRESSRDRDPKMVKHKHSFSESGKIVIPIWDSSDPERAPPPLPLNPGTSSPISKPNTSARIEEAAALITAKAREHSQSTYNPKTISTGSPEKSLIKGHHHKRMQSLQTTSVRDLSSSLERRSPDKGLGRDSSFRSSRTAEHDESPERNNNRSQTPTPSGRESPTRSYLNRPILGENTPPSATMLALQNMRSQSERDTPLNNITNGGPSSKAPLQFDALSSQLLSLTSICTNLQREMAQLSRRSKDNATDLVSLKEATNSRDEDIRKSLKDLAFNISEKLVDVGDSARSPPNIGSYLLDNKAHTTPIRSKHISLPRIPSPNSFTASIERELTASPSMVSSDGSASIALLEKVLREMGTKEGQENILKALERVTSSSSKSEQTSWDPTLSRKLEDILNFMKDSANSQALIRAGSSGGGNNNRSPPMDSRDFGSPRSGQLTRAGRDTTPRQEETRAADSQIVQAVNDEMMAILKRIKGSVAEGGGLTNEVKALVRELRGEVLGMGREIARKLEQVVVAQTPTKSEPQGPTREEIAQIVEGGLTELGDHMNQLIEQQKQQLSDARPTIDPQEVYHAVRSAIADQMPHPEDFQTAKLEKEEILLAVREAWEDCKPEIELQNFGLERDEILDCLKDGLKSYQPSIGETGATYEEVLEAVQKGLRDFRPPPIETESSITREEILVAVRECLESFDFPQPMPVTREPEITKEDVFEAVKEGLQTQPDITKDYVFEAVREGLQAQQPEITKDDVFEAVREGLQAQGPISKEIEFNRDDLFDAVKAGLEGVPSATGGAGEQVLEQMHEFISSMKIEFKQYSAANGKDTEQVLDAVKDGLEDLRADIESYVDRAADVTGKDEIIDTLKDGFRTLQDDIERGLANVPQPRAVDTPELLDAMEKEFNYLRETLTKTINSTGSPNDKSEILDAIRDISESDRGSSLTVDTTNVAAMVKDELEHLRETLAGMLVRQTNPIEREDILDAVKEGLEAQNLAKKGDGSESVLSNTSELLDAFQDGVDGLRADMQKLVDRPIDFSSGLDILDDLKSGMQNIKEELEKMHDSQRQVAEVSTTRDQELIASDSNLISTEIEGLKVMITQLRIKVEALDSMPPPEPAPDSVTKGDLEQLSTTLKEMQDNISEMASREQPAEVNAATKEDTDALETLLRNAKSQLDELDPEKLAKFEHIEALDDVLIKVKETVDAHKESGVSKEDFGIVESMLKEITSGFEVIQSKLEAITSDEERVTKADVQAIETLCLDTKTQIEELKVPDPEVISTKEDIDALQEKLKGLQEQIEADNELTAQAFDARKTEHGGLATKIDDARALISELREELMKKLDGSEEGIVELAKTLESHNETFNTFATVATLTELGDLLKENFEKTHSAHDATKLEVEERDAALLVKHEETKAAMTKEISDKVEEKFNELMLKYDDAQQAADTTKTETTEALTNTKTVVDDLKSVLDTLGTTITETCDRMSDDAKTVFIRVDETHTKVEELKSSSQSEHTMTRDEIAKTISAAERLESQLNEQHPAVLDAIKEIAAIVGQHYEHSKSASEEVKNTISSIPSAIPPLLPAPPLLELPPPPEKYDDTQVHEKLNQLIEHAEDAKSSLTQMEKLDEIHEKVLAAAGEISVMVATQSRLMAEHHDSKAQEAQEAAIALEKRNAQKEMVEADIVRLSQEREDLADIVAALRKENEELASQSKRLVREVGVLETALKMRQDEMKVMEKRAENLEKKILEGVMDHARSLMISRPQKKAKTGGAVTRDAAMNLKRVPSVASTSTRASTVKDVPLTRSKTPSTISNAVGLALKQRGPLQEGGNSRPGSAHGSLTGRERRIVSSSYLTPRPSLNADYGALVLAPTNNSNGGLVNLKRSQSVKSNPSSYYGGRKASWGGSRRRSNIANKENEMIVPEEDEENGGGHTSEHEQETDYGSDCGTERRTSFTGTVTDSDLYTVTDSMTYGTGSVISETESTGTRTVSYASSTKGEIAGELGEGGQYIGADEDEDDAATAEPGDELSEVTSREDMEDESITESEESHMDDETVDEELEDHEQQEDTEGKIMALLDNPHDPEAPPASEVGDEQIHVEENSDQAMKDLVMYQHQSDSGLGSELPSSALEGSLDDSRLD